MLPGNDCSGNYNDVFYKTKNVALNVCMNGDCSQLGTCSEDLCNTEENFIKMANPGWYTGYMEKIHENIVIGAYSLFNIFPF